MTEQTGGENNTESGNSVIKTSGSIPCGKLLNIACISELKNIFADAINNKSTLTIDTSTPERIDTAGIQLLCSFLKEAQQKDIEIIWEKDIPDKLREIAALLGLDEHLGISA